MLPQRKIGFALIAELAAIAMVAATLLGPARGHGETPAWCAEPLPVEFVRSVVENIGISKEHFRKVSEQGLVVPNSFLGVVGRFGPDGPVLEIGEEEVRLTWWGYGYAGEWNGASLCTVPVAGLGERRVEYHRGGVIEWYMDTSDGLQQGFTVLTPPGPRTGEPLKLRLTLGTSAKVLGVSENGTEAVLVGNAKGTLITYGPLMAWDATGRRLPTRIELYENELHLQIRDDGAAYPVVVDPLVRKATLTTGDNAETVGWGVAIEGNTVVLGAPGGERAAYVFLQPSGGWSGSPGYSAKLIGSDVDPNANTFFGRAVAVSGDIVVVGAPAIQVGTNNYQGAAYVFQRPLGGWSGTLTQVAKLISSDGQMMDNFGTSVDVQGDTIVVGATKTDPINRRHGAAYVFVRPPGGWSGTLTETAILSPPPGSGQDSFGQSVALDNDVVVVGAPHATVDGKPYQGAAYVFVKPAGGWVSTSSPDARIVASGIGNLPLVGEAVDISGDTIVVGAPGADTTPRDPGRGVALVVVKPPGGWDGELAETVRLQLVSSVDYHCFGKMVDIKGDTLVVGGNAESEFYLYRKPPGGWATAAGFHSAAVAKDQNGVTQVIGSLAMSGAHILVGCPYSAFSEGGSSRGLGLLFEDAPPPPVNAVSGYAVLKSPAAARARAILHKGASVLGGSACGYAVSVGRSGVIDGNVVGIARLRLGRDALVGATCVTGGATIRTKPGAWCAGGADTWGMHALLAECRASADAAETRRQELLSLVPSTSLGDVTLSTDTVLDTRPLGVTPVLDFSSLTIGPGVRLRLKGDASTQHIVIRVAGNFKVLSRGALGTEGIVAGPNGLPAERVLVLVGGKALIGNHASVAGTVFGQSRVSLGRSASLFGAVLSQSGPILIGPGASVSLAPWVAW